MPFKAFLMPFKATELVFWGCFKRPNTKYQFLEKYRTTDTESWRRQIPTAVQNTAEIFGTCPPLIKTQLTQVMMFNDWQWYATNLHIKVRLCKNSVKFQLPLNFATKRWKAMTRIFRIGRQKVGISSLSKKSFEKSSVLVWELKLC